MTNIEWADRTWNPVTGCTKISEGCLNCYAERMAKRLAGRNGYPKDNPFKPTFHEDRIDEPMFWRGSKKIFVCSMGDLFHEKIRPEWIARVIKAAYGSKHIFMILTKRPENMRAFFDRCGEWEGWITHNGSKPKPYGGDGIILGATYGWPLKNLWLGVTAENQEQVNKRVPVLIKIPAAVRFVSVEPMLSKISVDRYFGPQNQSQWLKVLKFRHPLNRYGLNWVICGGESGPGARPLNPSWVRSLRDQCEREGVPFFFKQWGEHDENGIRTGKKKAGRWLDGKTWEQYPEVSL